MQRKKREPEEEVQRKRRRIGRSTEEGIGAERGGYYPRMSET